MRHGKTIRLQLATPDDAELISEWRDNPGYVDPFQEIVPMPAHVLEKELAPEPYQPDRRGWWLIRSLESGEPMGLVLHFVPSAVPYYHSLEVGWEVRPAFRGRGIATEAACVLVNYLFNLTDTQRIQATITEGNEASFRVAESVGMQRDGICRKAGFARGLYVNLHLFSILREEWKDEESYMQGRPIV